MPAFVRAFLFKSSPNGELSYKAKKLPHIMEQPFFKIRYEKMFI